MDKSSQCESLMLSWWTKASRGQSGSPPQVHGKFTCLWSWPADPLCPSMSFVTSVKTALICSVSKKKSKCQQGSLQRQYCALQDSLASFSQNIFHKNINCDTCKKKIFRIIWWIESSNQQELEIFCIITNVLIILFHPAHPQLLNGVVL